MGTHDTEYYVYAACSFSNRRLSLLHFFLFNGSVTPVVSVSFSFALLFVFESPDIHVHINVRVNNLYASHSLSAAQLTLNSL